METFSARANYNDDETATEIVVSWTTRFALVNNQYYSICASLDYYLYGLRQNCLWKLWRMYTIFWDLCKKHSISHLFNMLHYIQWYPKLDISKHIFIFRLLYFIYWVKSNYWKMWFIIGLRYKAECRKYSSNLRFYTYSDG